VPLFVDSLEAFPFTASLAVFACHVNIEAPPRSEQSFDIPFY